MAYCVYHFEKGKGQATAIGNHIDRAVGKEHSYKNADSLRTHLNRDYKVTEHCKKPLQEAIVDRIAEGYKGKRAIRQDAVKYLKHTLTGSHERMHEIFSNPKLAERWIEENYKFISREFGKENIVRFTLHLDERTPHIHCVTVPLTEDGKLSAKIITGDKKALQERQSRYAEAMQQFGLERGLKGSKATHSTVVDFYKKVNEEKAKAIEVTYRDIAEPPRVKKPTAKEILFGKLDEWEERQNRELREWRERESEDFRREASKLGQVFTDELQKRRFKDISFVFAMRGKEKEQNALKSLKKAFDEIEEMQTKINQAELEKTKSFIRGRDELVKLINEEIKPRGVGLKIVNGTPEFFNLEKKKKRNRSQNRKRGMGM